MGTDSLYYIMDYSGNYYRTNQADQLVSVANQQDTRLSMQHLKITEQENDPQIKEGFIQLIPLTPETSFRMTTGGGSVQERALMYAILRRSILWNPCCADCRV